MGTQSLSTQQPSQLVIFDEPVGKSWDVCNNTAPMAYVYLSKSAVVDRIPFPC